jgi:hypothetical protein
MLVYLPVAFEFDLCLLLFVRTSKDTIKLLAKNGALTIATMEAVYEKRQWAYDL